MDKLYAKALKTADGSEAFLETGATRMSFTNPASGKTITQNGSGSFTATFFPDGSVTTVENGIGANALEPADAARFGLPGVFLATGKLTVTSAPDGTIYLAVPERPRSGGRVRGAELRGNPVPLAVRVFLAGAAGPSALVALPIQAQAVVTRERLVQGTGVI